MNERLQMKKSTKALAMASKAAKRLLHRNVQSSGGLLGRHSVRQESWVRLSAVRSVRVPFAFTLMRTATAYRHRAPPQRRAPTTMCVVIGDSHTLLLCDDAHARNLSILRGVHSVAPIVPLILTRLPPVCWCRCLAGSRRRRNR